MGRDHYKDVTILGSTVEDLAGYNNDATFDLIILSHVLEHFTDPVASLAVIADKMTQDSFLYIEVPNFYGHPSVQYAHNYCFTEASLRNCLAAAQLKPVKVDLFWQSRIFPMHITCLARKDANTALSAQTCRETVDEIARQRRAGQIAYRRHVVLTSVLRYSGFSLARHLLPNAVKNTARSWFRRLLRV